MDVDVHDPNFGQLLTCDCRAAQKETREFENLFEESNLKFLSEKTFQNFNPDLPGIRKAYTIAVAYAAAPQGWLFLFGNVGCGKTHLAAAIGNEMLKRNQAVIWAVVPDLLDYLRAAFNPSSGVDESYEDRFYRVRNTPLLILDDLGTETATPWAREKLFQIINHRYNACLPTVFTTNRSLDSIEERIRSRLSDVVLCNNVLINAGDCRHMRIDQRVKPIRSFGR
jgi:DNA replication protein DnaC